MKKGVIKGIIALVVLSLLGSGIALFVTLNNKVTYRDVEVRTTDDYVQYKYSDSEDWSNLVKLDTLVGKSGREVEIKKDGNFVKWKYTDEKEWTNLIDLTSLIGQDGKNGTNGKNGKNGKEIEVSTNDEYVVYRYKGDKEWTKLIKLSSLKGKDGSNGTDGVNGKDGNNGTNGTDGKEVEITKDDTYIKWRYKGEDTWNNLVELKSLKGQDGKNGTDGTNGKDGVNGTDGTNGVDGKEIELENDGTNIKWRYKGDTTWNTLTSLADLKGEKGDKGDKGDAGQDGKDGVDGSQIELINDGTYIKWKYKDSDEDYTNLVELDTLKGENGLAWINLGTVDVSPYCMTYDEGETNEHEECGYYEYLKLHFPEAEQGNYIFTDNEDNFVWHVKVEKAENEYTKYALIEYWSTEEVIPYYYRAFKGINDTEWDVYSLDFVTGEFYNYTINNLESSINSLEYQNLGNINVTDSCGDSGLDCSVVYIEKELVENKSETARYMFKDNEHSYKWLVDVQIADTGLLKTAYVEYWNSSTGTLYHVTGHYNRSKKIWTWDEPDSYASASDSNKKYEELKKENEELKARLEKLEWKDLGVVDTSDYCVVFNEGSRDELDTCGYLGYIGLNFSKVDEGKYIFTDSEDYFVWHVTVERSKMNNKDYTLIEYWSTEETMIYYMRVFPSPNGDGSTKYDIYYNILLNQWTDLRNENDNLEKRIKVLEDAIDELKNQNP